MPTRTRTEYFSPKSHDTIYIDSHIPGHINEHGEPLQRYESHSSRTWKTYVHWLTSDAIERIIEANNLQLIATEDD